MEVTFLVWKLPAFTVNRGKRLAKSTRLLWVDSGLDATGAEAPLAALSVSSLGRLWCRWAETERSLAVDPQLRTSGPAEELGQRGLCPDR